MNQKPISHQPGLIWITSPPGGTRWRIRCRTNRWHRPIAQFFFRVATNLLIHWLFIDCLTTVVPSEMQATGWLSGDQLNPPPLPQKKKKMKNTTTVTPHSSINWMATIIKSPISCFLTAPVAAPLLRPLLPISWDFSLDSACALWSSPHRGQHGRRNKDNALLVHQKLSPPKKKNSKKGDVTRRRTSFSKSTHGAPSVAFVFGFNYHRLVRLAADEKKNTKKNRPSSEFPGNKKKERNETLLIGC